MLENVNYNIGRIPLEVDMARKRKRTKCSIYLPLTDQVTKEDKRDLLKQLPEPIILQADFKAHNSLWGSEKISTRGRMLEKILDRYKIL